MQSATKLFLAALASTTAVSAQYAGQVFMTDKDSCPGGFESETQFVWDTLNGAICVQSPYSSSSWSAMMDGNLSGTTTIAPTRFGACPTSDCGSDCTTVDIVKDGNGAVSYDCLSVDNGNYIFIGY